MAAGGAGLEALALHGGRILRSHRPMVSTDTFPQQAVADEGEAGQEVRALGVQVGREARSMVEGLEARRRKGGHG